MAGSGFAYTALQANQKGWGDSALNIALQAQTYEKEKKKNWEKENAKRVEDSYKGIERPEDLTANVEKTYGSVYRQVSEKITDLNLKRRDGSIGDDEYYSKLHMYQDVPNQLKALSDSYAGMEKKLVEGDDVLSGSYANEFRTKNYVNGLDIKMNDEGMLNLHIPVKDEAGNITGYSDVGVSQQVADMNGYTTEPKLSDDITTDAITFGKGFEKSTVTYGANGERHSRSGQYSANDMARFGDLFDKKFGIDSKYVQKQAMLSNPKYSGSPTDIPKEELLAAQEYLKKTAVDAMGGTKLDTSPKIKEESSKKQDSADLRQRVMNNLDKALYNDRDALSYFMDNNFKYKGNLITSYDVEDDGSLTVQGMDEDENPVSHTIDPSSVKGFLLDARNNRDSGTKKDVTWDDLDGMEVTSGESSDQRFHSDATDKVSKSFKDGRVLQDAYFGSWDSTLSDKVNEKLELPKGTITIDEELFSDNKFEIEGETYNSNDPESMELAKKELVKFLRKRENRGLSQAARDKANKSNSKGKSKWDSKKTKK